MAPAAVSAADAPAQKPLRTLVYQITYTAHTLHQQQTSGFNGSLGNGLRDSGNVGVGSGSGNAAVGLNGDHSGTLTVDVIAATPDGGLVVDEAFTGSLVTGKKARIAIYPDGHLTAPPDVEIGPETLHILPLLARGFFASTAMAPGAVWTAAAQSPTHGAMTYHVQNVAGNVATIGVEGTMSMNGINGFSELDHGTTTYATDLDDPVSLDLTTHIERQLAIGETLTTDGHLSATLVSDTFKKS
jgi:hypothetical protein